MQTAHAAPRQSKNPYEGRWRFWYSQIADYMLANPTATHAAIAKHVGRAQNTISMIVITDSFKTHFEQRKREYHRRLADQLSLKLTRVAEATLDHISTHLEKKGDQVPMALLTDLASKTLDRLGFAPQSTPQVVVNNTSVDASRNVTVTASALEEARATLRQMERQKLDGVKPLIELESSVQSSPALTIQAAEPTVVRTSVAHSVIEDDDAAAPLTS